MAEAVRVPYLHMEYKNSFPVKESTVTRVALLIVPFLALYKPAGIFLSVFLGTTRSIFSAHQAYYAYGEKNYGLAGKKMVIASIATIAVANCFFQHHTGMIITSSSDILEGIFNCFSLVTLGQTADAFYSLTSIVNSSAYLGMLLCPSLEIILLSLTMQVLFEIVHSIKEFKQGKDRYLEGAARLLMASIRSYQARPYAQAFLTVHGSKISAFADRQREKIAWVMHRVAAYLAVPRQWYGSKVMHMFTPIKPERPDQCSSKVGEVSLRIFYGLLFVPMFFLSLGCSAVSETYRILATFIQPHSYFYREGNLAKEKQEIGPEITIMTENIANVEFSEAFAGVQPWRKRADKIVGQILEKNPDVVCLQEVNDPLAADYYYKKLKDDYAHIIDNVGSKEKMYIPFKNHSGLMLFTNYAPFLINFYPFHMGQIIVNKGVLEIALACQGKVFAQIFTTHLSPSKDDFHPKQEEMSVRQMELEMIKEKMMDAKKQHPNALIALVGDMNMKWGGEEWQQSLFASEDFFDPYNHGRTTLTREEATCATDDMIRAYFNGQAEGWNTSDPLILDYAVVMQNRDGVTQGTTEMLRSYDPHKDPHDASSDHNRLLLKMLTST